MLLLLLLFHNVFTKETSPAQPLILNITSCPDEGYFFRREPLNLVHPQCYLCFCQEVGSAICWERKTKRCDVEGYHYHRVGREVRERRNPIQINETRDNAQTMATYSRGVRTRHNPIQVNETRDSAKRMAGYFEKPELYKSRESAFNKTNKVIKRSSPRKKYTNNKKTTNMQANMLVNQLNNKKSIYRKPGMRILVNNYNFDEELFTKQKQIKKRRSQNKTIMKGKNLKEGGKIYKGNQGTIKHNASLHLTHTSLKRIVIYLKKVYDKTKVENDSDIKTIVKQENIKNRVKREESTEKVTQEASSTNPTIIYFDVTNQRLSYQPDVTPRANTTIIEPTTLNNNIKYEVKPLNKLEIDAQSKTNNKKNNLSELIDITVKEINKDLWQKNLKFSTEFVAITVSYDLDKQDLENSLRNNTGKTIASLLRDKQNLRNSSEITNLNTSKTANIIDEVKLLNISHEWKNNEQSQNETNNNDKFDIINEENSLAVKEMYKDLRQENLSQPPIVITTILPVSTYQSQTDYEDNLSNNTGRLKYDASLLQHNQTFQNNDSLLVIENTYLNNRKIANITNSKNNLTHKTFDFPELKRHHTITFNNTLHNVKKIPQSLRDYKPRRYKGKILNVIKYMTKVLTKTFPSSKKKTNDKIIKKYMIDCLCEVFGPCKIKPVNYLKLLFKLDELHNKTEKLLITISNIKALLKHLEAPKNQNITHKRSNVLMGIVNIYAILHQNYTNRKDAERNEQRNRINEINQNARQFIESLVNFAPILSEVIILLTSGVEPKKVMKPIFSDTHTQIEKLKKQMFEHNIFLSTLIKNNQDVNTKVDEKKGEQKPQYLFGASENKTIELGTTILFDNLRLLKNYAETLKPKERVRRSLNYDKNSMQILLTLIDLYGDQSLLSQRQPDGIDIILDAIKNSPQVVPPHIEEITEYQPKISLSQDHNKHSEQTINSEIKPFVASEDIKNSDESTINQTDKYTLISSKDTELDSENNVYLNEIELPLTYTPEETKGTLFRSIGRNNNSSHSNVKDNKNRNKGVNVEFKKISIEDTGNMYYNLTDNSSKLQLKKEKDFTTQAPKATLTPTLNYIRVSFADIDNHSLERLVTEPTENSSGVTNLSVTRSNMLRNYKVADTSDSASIDENRRLKFYSQYMINNKPNENKSLTYRYYDKSNDVSTRSDEFNENIVISRFH